MFILDPRFRILDPTFTSWILDPGSRVEKDLGSGSAIKNVSFFAQKPYTKFSKIISGMFLPDPRSWIWIFYIYQIPDTATGSRGKKHRIPDPGSQNWF
jgi:hypothetical protein